MPRLSISLLGSFLVTLDGQTAAGFDYDKVRALLSYLALEPERPQRRETLAGLLWPEQPEKTARNSLRQALSKLRQTTGDREADPPFIHISREAIQFNQASDYQLDAAEFNALLAKCQSHAHRRSENCSQCAQWREEALEQYQGDLLAGFSLTDSAPFEEWLLRKREGFHRQALNALYDLAAYHIFRGNYRQAYEFAIRQISMESWREEAHRQAMRALAYGGHRTAALAQFIQCQEALNEHLDVPPEAETIELNERIRQNILGDAPADRRLTGLIPQPALPLIGRQAELDELTELLLTPACRLLCISGPGGIGKTRLAQAIALQLEEDFAHGAALIPLETLASTVELPSAIANQLRLRLQGYRSPAEELLDFLEGKELLLILDNYEQLLPDVAFLSALISRGPGLVLLVTSRQRLGLAAEWVYDLSGLDFPVESGEMMLEQYDAAQLFFQRALQVNHDFSIVDCGQPAVARICRLSEGMPLAIELAASSVRYYPCNKIVERLEGELNALSIAFADRPERHHSLQAVFEYSWNLLTPKEQQVFSQLSIFRGGLDDELALQVTGTSAQLLQELADKSLLKRVAAGRYNIHPLMRQFAADKLNQSGDETSVREKHLVAYAELSEEGEVGLRGGDQIGWLERLDRELPNILAAFEWGLENDLETAARLASGNWGFWFVRGKALIGKRLYDSLLDGEVELSNYQRARALNGRASMAMAFHDIETMEKASEEALALFQILEDEKDIIVALLHLHVVAAIHGDNEKRLALLEEAHTYAQEIEDTWFNSLYYSHLGQYYADSGDYRQAEIAWSQARTLNIERGDEWLQAVIGKGLADLASYQGESDRAKSLYQESLTQARLFGDRQNASEIIYSLAQMLLAEDALVKADALFEQCYDECLEIGAQDFMAKANLGRGDVAARQGNFQKALSYYKEGAKLFLKVQDAQSMISSLTRLAELNWHKNGAKYAVHWLGTVAAQREQSQLSLPPSEVKRFEQLESSMRQRLGEGEFDKLWTEGQSLSIEEVLQGILMDD